MTGWIPLEETVLLTLWSLLFINYVFYRFHKQYRVYCTEWLRGTRTSMLWKYDLVTAYGHLSVHVSNFLRTEWNIRNLWVKSKRIYLSGFKYRITAELFLCVHLQVKTGRISRHFYYSLWPWCKSFQHFHTNYISLFSRAFLKKWISLTWQITEFRKNILQVEKAFLIQETRILII